MLANLYMHADLQSAFESCSTRVVEGEGTRTQERETLHRRNQRAVALDFQALLTS